MWCIWITSIICTLSIAVLSLIDILILSNTVKFTFKLYILYVIGFIISTATIIIISTTALVITLSVNQFIILLMAVISDINYFNKLINNSHVQ